MVSSNSSKKTNKNKSTWARCTINNQQLFFYFLKFIMLTIKVNSQVCMLASVRKATLICLCLWVVQKTVKSSYWRYCTKRENSNFQQLNIFWIWLLKKLLKKAKICCCLTTFGYTLKQTITLFTQLCWEGKTTAAEQHKTEQSSKLLKSEKYWIIKH